MKKTYLCPRAYCVEVKTDSMCDHLGTASDGTDSGGLGKMHKNTEWDDEEDSGNEITRKGLWDD